MTINGRNMKIFKSPCIHSVHIPSGTYYIHSHALVKRTRSWYMYYNNTSMYVYFSFFVYIGLLAHYSFSPGDKRSARIKHLYAAESSVGRYWWIFTSLSLSLSLSICHSTRVFSNTLGISGIYCLRLMN